MGGVGVWKGRQVGTGVRGGDRASCGMLTVSARRDRGGARRGRGGDRGQGWEQGRERAGQGWSRGA